MFRLTFDEWSSYFPSIVASSYFPIVKNECKSVKINFELLESYVLSVCSMIWIQDG